MSDTESTVMDADERDAFLGTGGTGVISFPSSGDEPPHSVPVSYGYDRSKPSFYFRLAVEHDSDKGDVAGRHVTFVVYGRQEENWQSVIVRGQLKKPQRRRSQRIRSKASDKSTSRSSTYSVVQ